MIAMHMVMIQTSLCSRLRMQSGKKYRESESASNDIEPKPAVIIAANQYAGKFASGEKHSCYIKPDNSIWCGAG